MRQKNKPTPSCEAERLVKRYHTRDPFALALQTGARVRYRDLGHLKGLYLLFDRCRYILLNQNLADEERRMVCAHELGHDRLHRGIAKSAFFQENQLFCMSGKMEHQANLFAAELLLGDDHVLELQAAGDLASIAKLLGVHPQLVLFKLNAMNARGYRFSLPQDCKSDFFK